MCPNSFFQEKICFKIVTFFREARVVFGCVSSNSYASLVLSKLPATHERILYEPLFYLVVGTQHWRHYYTHSCEYPILRDCIQISMSRLLHTERKSAISDQLLVQMLHLQVLSKLHRIQTYDKLQRSLQDSVWVQEGLHRRKRQTYVGENQGTRQGYATRQDADHRRFRAHP